MLQVALSIHLTCFGYNPSARTGLLLFFFMRRTSGLLWFLSISMNKGKREYPYIMKQTCRAFDIFSRLSLNLCWDETFKWEPARIFIFSCFFKTLWYCTLPCGSVCLKSLCLVNTVIILQGLYFVVWRDLMLETLEGTFVIYGNRKSGIYSGVAQLWQCVRGCERKDTKWQYHIIINNNMPSLRISESLS